MSTIGLNRAAWEWAMRTFAFCGVPGSKQTSRYGTAERTGQSHITNAVAVHFRAQSQSQ